MEKELAAALKAAKAYKVRNDGDRGSAELIVAMLEDCSARVGMLEGFADEADRKQKIAEAQDALRQAESA